MILVRIIVDSREQSIGYMKKIKIDKRVNKDGVKIVEVVQECCKPLGCSKSTGDVTYQFSTDDGSTWTVAPFSIELKKSLDSFSSIYSKSNFDRLKKEIDRAKDAKIDFYFVITDSIYITRARLEKVRKIGKNADVIYLNKYMELNRYLTKSGFDSIITTGGKSSDTLAWVIRRLIKNNIKKLRIK